MAMTPQEEAAYKAELAKIKMPKLSAEAQAIVSNAARPGGTMHTTGFSAPTNQDLNARIINDMLARGQLTSQQVQNNSQTQGVNMSQAFGNNAVQGVYAPTPSTPQGATPAPQAQAQPQTTPLPSSSGPSPSYSIPQAQPINWDSIRGRATNDASLQVDMLRQQAQQGYGRMKTNIDTALAQLANQYSGAYRDIQTNTELAARDALERSAARGFAVSGLSADAQAKAYLSGENLRATTQNQQIAGETALRNQMTQATTEYNDMLGALEQRKAGLIQSLIDQYGQQAQDNQFRDRSLDTQTALQLMGLQQNMSQFNQTMAWDKDKFGQQYGYQQQRDSADDAFRNKSLEEQIAARMWGQQFQQGQADRQWQQTGIDNQFRQDQANIGNQFNRDQFDWQKQYQQGQLDLQNSQFNWQQSQAGKDNSLGWARLGFDQQQWSDQKGWKEKELALQGRELDMVGKQMTAQYMGFLDDAMDKASKNDPQALALGYGSPQGLADWVNKNAMRMAAEGVDVQSLLNYVKIKTGQSVPANVGQPGPINPINPNPLYRPNQPVLPDPRLKILR